MPVRSWVYSQVREAVFGPSSWCWLKPLIAFEAVTCFKGPPMLELLLYGGAAVAR